MQNLKEIKKEYPVFENIPDRYFLEMYNSVNVFEEEIFEYLKSLNINTVKRVIDSSFGHLNIRMNTISDNLFSMTIFLEYEYYVDYNYFINEILYKLKILGWYCSMLDGKAYSEKTYNKFIIGKIKSKAPWLSLRFESIHSQSIDLKDRGIEKIYHITTLDVVEKIKKFGLSPKNGIKNIFHPKRIYFLTNLDNVNTLSVILYKTDKKNPNNDLTLKENTEKYLITVNVKDLKSNVTFFNDPEIGDNGEAIYTYFNIPPNILKIEKLS
jgi:hypothetical protein